LNVVELSVEREKRAAVEEKQCETEEEEDAFEVALAAVAEDDHHPKEHQQRAGGVADQANVEEDAHLSCYLRLSEAR
jgi:hypothetical protein